MKHYFGPDTARRLGEQLGIDGASYAQWVAPRVDDLAVILPRLGPELAEGEGYFNHAFHLWPVSRFIETYGLDHPEASLDAIESLTRAFTGEWAVRPYLAHYPSLTMSRVHEWSRSASHNVRRLSTEGIRPRLPWAPQHRPFIEDPSPITPILDRLYCDPSKFVRTSVANNLNDISRTHPALALETAARWLGGFGMETRGGRAAGGGAAGGAADSAHADGVDPRGGNVKWVVERGLRTLVKQGNQEALALVGYGASDDLRVLSVSVPDRVAVGEAAPVAVTLHNAGTEPIDVMVDYRVHFLKSNGQRRPSAFKLGRVTLGGGETKTVGKKHSFKLTSTRSYYPGTQALSVVVNGIEAEAVEFDLT